MQVYAAAGVAEAGPGIVPQGWDQAAARIGKVGIKNKGKSF